MFCFRYYMEILQQEYGGAATINLGLFQGESSYTEDQTADAVNEVQDIGADYDVFDEEQVQHVVATPFRGVIRPYLSLISDYCI